MSELKLARTELYILHLSPEARCLKLDYLVCANARLNDPNPPSEPKMLRYHEGTDHYVSPP